eukprot:XP_011661657.1 PREDICTED: proliferating cell nuclear antigen [Strongylocentrotus purpuratus]
MFEARLLQGSILKKALEGIRELITSGNWECSSAGISMQGMDPSHVALTVLMLQNDLFDQFRCDRNVTLGLNHATFSKILKCAANDDIITLKAEDQPDECNLLFQSANDDKTSDFIIKLTDIDQETLGIPVSSLPQCISMQGMDPSHVALTVLMLQNDLFDQFRCDRNVTLGLNHATFSKILKCAANDDIITLKAEDQPDECNLLFQSANDDKTSDFIIKLTDIDQETLGIPDTEYAATVKVPSVEFQRICRDLSQFGDTIIISVKKGCVEFSGTGEIGSAKIALKESGNVDDDEKVSVEMDKDTPCSLSFASRYLNYFTKATSLSDTVTLQLFDTEYAATVKVPSVEFQRICRDLSQFGDTIIISVKKGCVEFSGTGEIGSAKIALKESGNVDDDEKVSVEMDKDTPCSLSFASRYLNYFTKATSLSDTVTLQLCPEHPLVVSYDIGDNGSLKYYLAPKIEED